MVTREIDDQIPVDRAVLRHIVRDLDQNLGIYATIVTPGVVAVGDRFEFVCPRLGRATLHARAMSVVSRCWGFAHRLGLCRGQRIVAVPHEWYEAIFGPGT